MPIVLFVFALGIFVGYWICRKQLAGKFILVEEEMEAATWRSIEMERELHPTPPLPPPPLSEQWGLPNYHNRPQPPTPEFNPLDLPLYREDGRPQWSAKQILGYNLWGFEHPPQYPGGLPVWDAVVNGISPDDEEL